VQHKGPSKRTDYGTIVFHWLLAASLVLAIGTGLRIATESAAHAWIIKLDPLLPQAAVWTGHLQAAIGLLAASAGYVVYMWRARLGRRLRLDRVRLKGLLGSRFARWGAINIALYRSFFAVMLSQLLTGGLLYFGYANSFVVQIHWFGMWAIIAYIAVHVYSQWHYGGLVQLLRVFRPKQPVALPRQFGVADALTLLDQQIKRSVKERTGAVHSSPKLAYQINSPAQAAIIDLRSARASDVFKQAQQRSVFNVASDSSLVLPNENGSIRHYSFIVACVASAIIVLVALQSNRLLIDELHIHRVNAVDVPTIDGETSDPIWRKIAPLYVVTENGGNFGSSGETTVSIQAVHDGVRAYFLFIWDDPTRSLKQLPLRKTHIGWQLLHDGYENGDEYSYSEDKFSILLTNLHSTLAGDTTFHAGVAPVAGQPDSASGRGLHYADGQGVSADIWDWRATSTNPSKHCDDDYFGPPAEATLAQLQGQVPYRGGFAHDPGTADYQDNFTPGLDRNFVSGVVPRRLPKKINDMKAALGRLDLDPNHGESERSRWYITDEESVPYSSELDRFIPEGTVIPGVFVSGEYSGDRAEVNCAGRWAAGRWALEVTRRLDVTSPYHIPIRSGVFMRVAAFDHTQIRHTRHVRPIRLEVQ
jgi:Ethylbenzene dehydrogenase/Prokaryotic cytochrome b561